MALGFAAISETAVSDAGGGTPRSLSGAPREGGDAGAGTVRVAVHGTGAPAELSDRCAATAFGSVPAIDPDFLIRLRARRRRAFPEPRIRAFVARERIRRITATR